jgi:uncharacterized repeat protein (TIGR03803 family)
VLYGTTANGGSSAGTVFEITTNGALTNLTSFAEAAGTLPQAGLALGNDGNLYGTTTSGGTNGGYGTIFRASTAGTFTLLASFASVDGASPNGVLTLGPDGSFYGSTVNGGTNGGYGTVFKVTTNGLLTSLVSFGNTNGANPYAGLTPGSDGNFYGTTVGGGTNGGYGTVFKVTTNGLLASLAAFDNTNGAYPYGGLTLAGDGNFYGTTYSGGSNGYGTVFMVTTNGGLTSLAAFGNTNGANPYGGLTWGSDGNLYGTTVNGGTNGGYGTVFKVTTNGLLTTLACFNNLNGSYPYAALTPGSDGNFYGTTYSGGNGGFGTAFQVTTNGGLTSLASFSNNNGAHPQAGWVVAGDGNFYGTTAYGGSGGEGVVMELVVPPNLRAVAYRNSTFQAALNGLARPLIQIQATPDLTAAWSVVTNLVFTNGIGQFIDPATAGLAHKFYRAVVP